MILDGECCADCSVCVYRDIMYNDEEIFSPENSPCDTCSCMVSLFVASTYKLIVVWNAICSLLATTKNTSNNSMTFINSHNFKTTTPKYTALIPLFRASVELLFGVMFNFDDLMTFLLCAFHFLLYFHFVDDCCFKCISVFTLA